MRTKLCKYGLQNNLASSGPIFSFSFCPQPLPQLPTPTPRQTLSHSGFIRKLPLVPHTLCSLLSSPLSVLFPLPTTLLHPFLPLTGSFLFFLSSHFENSLLGLSLSVKVNCPFFRHSLSLDFYHCTYYTIIQLSIFRCVFVHLFLCLSLSSH